MNPRQRRGVLLLLMTVLAAALTFVGVAAYVNSVASQVGPMKSVVRLTTDVKALHRIQPSDVEVVEVPARWVAANSVTSFGQIEGLVTVGSYYKGEILQAGMLEPPPGLEPGYREVSIMVDAETGVAGRVSSGDHVDIIASIDNEQTGEQLAQVIVQNVLVIDVGVKTQVQDESESGGFQSSEKLPITFALSTADSLKVAHAESFALKLRLALRGAGDDAELSDPQSQYATQTGKGRQ